MELCDSLRPKTAIETGFCTGRSAVSVLHGSTGSIEKMISIDKDLSWTGKYGPQMAEAIKEKFPAFRLIEDDSKKVLTPSFFTSEFPQKIDFGLIDGDHSYEGCSFDLYSIAENLSTRGMIVVDDFYACGPNATPLESVNRAVEDFLRLNSNFRTEKWHSNGKGMAIIKRAA